MTIAVATGSRKLHVSAEYWPLLDAAREEYSITELWHGGASGSDEGVEVWAKARGLTVERFEAPWELLKAAGLNEKAAGMRRNADMLDGKRGYAIAEVSQVDSQLALPEHAGDAAPSHRTLVTTEQLHGQPEVVLALPGYRGTRGAIREAEKRQLVVHRVMVEPMVINRWWFSRKDRSGFDLPPDTWSIMRGESPLGNPFRVGDPHPLRGTDEPITGDECMDLYRRWLFGKIRERDRAVVGTLLKIPSTAHLKCACLRPDGSGICHGHVVLRAWRWLHRRHVDGPGHTVRSEHEHGASLQPVE